MKILEEQGTDEWYKARLGKITGSRVKDVITKGRGGKPSKTRLNYMYELVAELLSGDTKQISSAAIEHGNEYEDEAIHEYESIKMIEVTKVGFLNYEFNDSQKLQLFTGASPDGLVPDQQGGIEVKCPDTKTHIETLIEDKVPRKYIPQIQWCMCVTGADWWDFVSYDPRIGDPDKRVYVSRVERDDQYILTLKISIKEFITEYEKLINKLNIKLPWTIS